MNNFYFLIFGEAKKQQLETEDRKKWKLILLRNVSKLAILLAAISGVGSALSMPYSRAIAGEDSWLSTPYNYVVINQDLKDVLQNFADNFGIGVHLSDEISGEVRGSWPKSSARSFLESLAQQFAFDWYLEGGTLYVTAKSEARTGMLALGPVDFAGFKSELTRLGLFDSRYPLRFSAESNLALVSGPPRYVAMVEETLVAMGGREVAADVIVLRGKTSAEP